VKLLRFLLIALLLCIPPAIAAENRAQQNLSIDKTQTIYIPATASKEVIKLASLLQEKLYSLYAVDIEISQEKPASTEAVTIHLGRERALADGLVTEQYFEEVKHDGYVITTQGNRIALAGYAVQGTKYATYRFLREIGLKFYPWQSGADVEVFKPLTNRTFNTLNIKDKPFFEFRDLFSGREKGQFGTTMRQHSLGELRFAREQPEFKAGGYIGWDHTAGYLVPMLRYRDEHPEYYGKLKGFFRAPKETRTLRVPLCTCNKDVQAISAQRALEWMAIQPGRRHFMISNGDSTADCPVCELSDPLPDYQTDRELAWVNSVARNIKNKFPENTLFTLAYGKTTKPPLETSLESNVVVLYAPWYWTSRATSAVSLDHPINHVAEKEFLEWTRKFPGQIGIYDYPGAWVYGTAERIKFYAKHGVRWIYFNGPRNNMLHWVASQLLWDPDRDIDGLITEYTNAVYGSAALPMQAYWQLRREIISKYAYGNHRPLEAPEFSNRARRLLHQAEQIAEMESPETRIRILEGVAEGWYAILRYADPTKANEKQLSSDFKHYVRLNQRLYTGIDKSEAHKGIRQLRQREFSKSISGLGIKLDREEYVQALLDKESTNLYHLYDEKLTQQVGGSNIHMESPNKRCVSINFGGKDEVTRWRATGATKGTHSAPRPVEIWNIINDKLYGIQIDALLSKLPNRKNGNRTEHDGAVTLERDFTSSLNVKGCRYIDIHLFSNLAVPITVQINGRGGIKSDVKLVPGEQFIRIDLKNYQNWLFKTPIKMERVTSIAFQILPQDNYYPYLLAKDVELTVLGMEIKNAEPASSNMPYQEKVTWMTSYRANVSHGSDVKREKFRSFTKHRVIYPTRKDSGWNGKSIQSNGFYPLAIEPGTNLP